LSVDDQDPAGALLIKEVDEDLRREQYIKLWQAYGKYAIAGALAIVLGVAGHQIWQGWRDKQFQKTASQLAAAEELVGAEKKMEAEAKLAEIAKGDQAGFAMAAAFRKAEIQSESGDGAGAVASYDAIAKSDAPVLFRDLATLKGVLLTLDTADPETLLKKVQPLADAGNPWHYTATELLALLASRRGDKAGAVSYYQKLADDAAAPQDIRARAVDMIAALGGGPAAAKPEKG
jgi:hypothetical protein